MAKKTKKEVFKNVAELLNELAWAEKNRMSQQETIAYQLYLEKRQAVLSLAHEVEREFHAEAKRKTKSTRAKLSNKTKRTKVAKK